MPGVMALRHAVFVVEQGVPPELEHDGLDATALHLLAEGDGAIVGCCRLVRDGGAMRLGRMAVAAPGRRRGVGARLLRFAEDVARDAGATEVTLHAQVGARGFYARAGYAEEGDEFLDAGIVHVAMRRGL
jgi:predicted GNAT family N-acyltransferase